jgi:acetyl esterase/lipase
MWERLRSPARWVIGALAAVVVVVLALTAFSKDPPDVDLPPREPGEARVSWGEPEEGEPRGVVMLLHGGGWQPSDRGFLQQKENAVTLNDEGYATVAVGYAGGATGFTQVKQVYRQARKRYPNLPICVSGISSGGHLGLMLATQEPDLACVINLSGPVDLTTLAKQDEDADEGYRAAVAAFGKDALKKYSPIRLADRIKARVLMIVAEDDPVNPVEQADELERALPSAEVLVLPKGPEKLPFAHFGGVEPEAIEVALERELDFLSESMPAR